MLLNNVEKLECGAAGFLGSGLPFLDSGFTGVEVAGENGLAHAEFLANSFDVVW